MLLFFVSLFTVGLGSVVVYPYIQLEYYRVRQSFADPLQRSINDVKLGDRALYLDVHPVDYFRLKAKTYAFSILTLGFYQVLGFAAEEEARFIDAHIRVVIPDQHYISQTNS